MPQMLSPALLALLASPICFVAAPMSDDAGSSTQEPLPPRAEDDHTALELSLAGRVDDDRAAELVRQLVAVGPRMGGTPSGARAVALLEREFAEIGVKTQRHLGKQQWCHAESNWFVEVKIQGEAAYRLKRIWPWGFSPAGEGEGVRLASGTARTETKPGVALLTQTYAGTRRKAQPSALVLVDGANTLDGEWPVCRALRRRDNQAATFGISESEGARLRAALAAGKAVTLDWKLETEIAQAKPITVIATIPAAEGAPAGHLLVCAHGDSDSGGPGANDNASGVAIVVEMARAWSAAIKDGDLPPPTREVRFAIWGTEIASTRAYLESELGRDVLCVINFDQAGYGTGGQRIHVEPDDLAGNAAFIGTAGAVLRKHVGSEGFPSRWATNKSLGGTDSYIFSSSKRFREQKLPAVTMFTSAWGSPDEHDRTDGMPGESWTDRKRVAIDYDVHYHSAGDTPENTTDKEPENMGWCARVGLLTALRYLESLD